MVKFRESQTAINLHTSFAAETQARTRYDFFANKAGMKGISRLQKYLKRQQARNSSMPCGFLNFLTEESLRLNGFFPQA